MAAGKKIRPKFSNEEESRLIDLVEECPILWDTTSDVYKRSDLRPQVWSDVASSIGPVFTDDDVMQKFKSMKDNFMKNLRKVHESRRSGVGTDDVYKPKWNKFNRVMFLKKTCIQYGSSSNVVFSESPTEVIDTQHYPDENLMEIVSIPLDVEESACFLNPMSPPSTISVPGTPIPSTPSPVTSCSSVSSKQAPKRRSDVPDQAFSKRASKEKPATGVLQNALGVLQDISARRDSDPAEKAVSIYRAEMLCSWIAERLRKMDDVKMLACEDALLTTLMKFS